MTRPDESAKRAALLLLRRGVVTQAEIPGLAGVSKQTASRWARETDAGVMRDKVLQRLWRGTIPRVSGN